MRTRFSRTNCHHTSRHLGGPHPSPTAREPRGDADTRGTTRSTRPRPRTSDLRGFASVNARNRPRTVKVKDALQQRGAAFQPRPPPLRPRVPSRGGHRRDRSSRLKDERVDRTQEVPGSSPASSTAAAGCGRLRRFRALTTLESIPMGRGSRAKRRWRNERRRKKKEREKRKLQAATGRTRG